MWTGPNLELKLLQSSVGPSHFEHFVSCIFRPERISLGFFDVFDAEAAVRLRVGNPFTVRAPSNVSSPN